MEDRSQEELRRQLEEQKKRIKTLEHQGVWIAILAGITSYLLLYHWFGLAANWFWVCLLIFMRVVRPLMMTKKKRFSLETPIEKEKT